MQGCVPNCPRLTSCSRQRWPASAARSGPARWRWLTPSSTPCSLASISPCRPGRAPASPSPTWCRRSATRSVASGSGPGGTVVVSTATIALQRQLIERDLPRLAASLSGAARPGAGLRDPEGPAQLPVPEQGPRHGAGRAGGLAVRPALGLGDRPSGDAAARVGGDDGYRRPGRAHSRRRRPGLAAGLGQRAGVHRRAEVPVRHAVLRRAGAGARLARPTSS